MNSEREVTIDVSNPLGLDGIEFVEYATSKPQALGQVLEAMGFRPIARHRSREVLLYRQGGMNIIINAHVSALPRSLQPTEIPVIAAVAASGCAMRAPLTTARRTVVCGVPAHIEGMEPTSHRYTGSAPAALLYRPPPGLSIYDVDFTRNPTVDPYPPALAGMHWSASCST